MLKKLTQIVGASALLAASSIASATVIYNEAVSGDASGTAISGLLTASTNLGTLAVGTSSVLGENTAFDNDWFSFVIGAGTQLDAIRFFYYSGAGGNAGWAIGTTVQADFAGPVDATAGSSNLLTVVDWASAGGTSPGSFLAPGSYAFKIGTGNVGGISYGLNFVVSATTPPPAVVPEPGTLGLLGAGTLAAVGLRRRRRV